MKRIFWILLTPAILIFILSLIIDLLVFPKVTAWATQYAQNLLRKEAQLELTVGSIHMRFLRLSIFLEDVKLVPLRESKLPLQDIRLVQAQVRLDPWELLLGQIRISAIILDELNLKLDVDAIPQDSAGPKILPVAEIFKWADKIPISRLGLRKSHLQIFSKKYDVAGDIQPLDLLFTNTPQRLSLRIYSPAVAISSQRFAEPASFSIESLMTLERTKLSLQGQIMSSGQTLSLSSSVFNPEQVLINPIGELQAKLSSDLKPLSGNLKNFISQKFPTLTGQVQMETLLKFKGRQNLQGHVDLSTMDITVGDFELGDLKTQAQFAGQEIQFNEIQLKHPAGSATLKKNSISLSSPYGFKTEVSIHQLDLQRLMQALNLHSVPVWMTGQGELPCEGQIRQFELNCKGEIRAQNLLVKTGMKETEKVIVEVPEGGVIGSLHVDLEKVYLKTQTHFGDGQGPVEGKVVYDKGFDFKFKTDSLDFKNIKQISGLDLKGETVLDGFTRGDSNAAILSINTKVNNFVFEKYILGTLNGQLKYEKGHLTLKDIKGVLPNSVYNGAVDVNLNAQALSGRIQLPKTDLRDVAQIFQNIYLLPLEVRGEGAATIDFSGPFNFWKMSYNVNSQFRNGRIHGESFSSLAFNVESQNGLIEVKKIELVKGSGRVQMTGQIQSDQKAALVFEGINFRLEESELINKIKSNLVGAFNFNGGLQGNIFNPDLTLKGHVAELMIDEQEIPSSFFQMKINRESFEADATLFGNKIQGEVKIPWGASHLPLKIRAKTIDWNFASVLSLLGASQLQEEYESQLTSDLDLSSENGDWTAISGSVNIKNFFLKRGGSSLRNSEPIDLAFNHGRINMKRFKLQGPNTDIEIKGDDFSFRDLNIAVSASSDLRLVHILVPFLEDLGGPFQMQATLSGSYDKPEILGNANIENAFVKLKGFPHPLEKLKADILFSHTKLVVQNIKGYLAGGTVNGEGNVSINGLKDFPTMIRIKAEGLSLNIPDKIKSQGNANLTFSGHWFPFTLGGVYNVTSALIEKEFSDGDTKAQIRDSIYLPKVLKEATFDPVLLDLQVNLDRNVVVKNSQVDGTISGQVQVKGRPTNPVILGKITVEKNSKLIFKSNLFEVQTGSVNFNNPNELMPDLYITAQARVSDYDVNLLVQGIASNPTIKLSSIPPLPDQEIISLLALGVTSEKLEQSQSRDQATRVGYEAGAVFLNQIGVNKGLQSTLGVNFELSSSFDNTKNANVPRVTFRKKLSRKWSTSYSQGVESGQGPKEVKLQYQINSNLSGVGSWESRDYQEGTSVRSSTKETSVFGMDLEFKREFK